MLSMETPVAQVVLDHSECASVFDRYRIDYCCKGTRPLRTACEERGLDPVRVIEDCELAMKRREVVEVDPRSLSTRELITRVIARHHQYLHRTLPFLVGLAHKVARVHGERGPELRELARVVDALAKTLLAHLDDEERELFPELLGHEAPTERAVALLRGMRQEHEHVGEMLSAMRSIANDYAAPEWACNSYRTLFSELAHLEADTLRHVHVENHVLLPRFIAST
jgi:regulator of cell morphogenesis and NO signaling